MHHSKRMLLPVETGVMRQLVEQKQQEVTLGQISNQHKMKVEMPGEKKPNLNQPDNKNQM